MLVKVFGVHGPILLPETCELYSAQQVLRRCFGSFLFCSQQPPDVGFQSLSFKATALLMLPHWAAGVNLSASMHFPHVRFALLHWLLCDRCAANVATVGGRSKPERLYAFSACAFCIGALATLRPLRC